MPNLRSRDAYRDAAWDWACLDGCFGERIRPTDIDGAVERRGHLLLLEAKPAGGSIPLGQGILFESASRKPLVSVVAFFGEQGDEPSVTSIVVFHGGRRLVASAPSLDRMREMVSAWFRHADSGSGADFDWEAFLSA